MDSNGGCLYRGPDGLKCAVGHLLTDEEHNEDMEHQSALDLYEAGLLPARLDPEQNIYFIIELQGIHDDYLPKEWHRALGELAQEFGLEA